MSIICGGKKATHTNKEDSGAGTSSVAHLWGLPRDGPPLKREVVFNSSSNQTENQLNLCMKPSINFQHSCTKPSTS